MRVRSDLYILKFLFALSILSSCNSELNSSNANSSKNVVSPIDSIEIDTTNVEIYFVVAKSKTDTIYFSYQNRDMGVLNPGIVLNCKAVIKSNVRRISGLITEDHYHLNDTSQSMELYSGRRVTGGIVANCTDRVLVKENETFTIEVLDSLQNVLILMDQDTAGVAFIFPGISNPRIRASVIR